MTKDLRKKIENTALLAGKAILRIYESSQQATVQLKSDNSPLTEADTASHIIIQKELAAEFPGIPLLSEEGREIPFSERKNWKSMFIVDPLDGTKEFIGRNGDFTVNIAYVEDGKPVVGVVYAPVTGELYSADAEGAYLTINGKIKKIHAAQRPAAGESLRIVASKSHLTRETGDFIQSLEKEYPQTETKSRGSSLKLCMVASGEAHVYPRLAPTMEWDTAAAQAVVEAAGGKVYESGTGKPLRYNKENLLNPWFVVSGLWN
jgi:3'(2'), 5'-bisphosphate nucleotidase